MALKTALVTGASGFIGSSVIRALSAQGIRPRALMRATSSKENLVGVEYDLALGDLSDVESLKRAVDGVSYIFHLAGCVAAKTTAEYFAHNAQGTENLAIAARQNDSLERFIYVSSLAAGGPVSTDTPRTESDSDSPISDYGTSKREGEERLRRHSAGKYNITVVRPPAVYGPRDRGIFEFVKLVKSGILPKFPARTKSREKYVSLIH
ncbi:MAG TPA: NAD-dependent epimerase/dehydratase family protein, partial [Oligoflexia bacterium]|nr:NAD-dependent epimerase/dehydratase family protein [Oligoflexia bacterium]